MRKMKQFDQYLAGIIGNEYHLYSNPPTKMEYPAVVYRRSRIQSAPANNRGYVQHTAYTVTVISAKPDDALLEVLCSLPLSAHTSSFKSGNLNHDVFMIYY